MSKKPRAVPSYTSPTGRYVDYFAVKKAALAARGAWLLVFPAAPTTRAKALRLRVPGIEVRIRNRYRDAGVPRGDVEVRVPKEET